MNLCCCRKKRNTSTISYLTPSLYVNIFDNNNYQTIGFDKSTNTLYLCYCNTNHEILKSDRILSLDIKSETVFDIIFPGHSLQPERITVERLETGENAGKIKTTSGTSQYYSDKPTTPFVKQGHPTFDRLDTFFNA
jgi:hypothetical protein